jgi:Zn-dependent membrane protease YugP
MFWYIDPVYMYVFFATLIISVGVQVYLKNSFSKWSQVANSSHVTGVAAAKTIFANTSLQAIPLEAVPGSMTDHFDPGANVVRLSEPVRKQPSIAAMAIAAHELGHVQQYQTGSAMIKARGFLLPALQFSPTLSYISLLLGFWFNMVNLIYLGIFFFSIMVLFSILTIPVEFNASKRGLKLLEEAGLMQTEEDRKGARSILRAAGMTYLAAAVTSILQLLYYISVAKRRS